MKNSFEKFRVFQSVRDESLPLINATKLLFLTHKNFQFLKNLRFFRKNSEEGGIKSTKTWLDFLAVFFF